jgi:hypothetical protein
MLENTWAPLGRFAVYEWCSYRNWAVRSNIGNCFLISLVLCVCNVVKPEGSLPCSPLVPVLSRINPLHTFFLCFSKILSSIILLSTSWSTQMVFSHQIFQPKFCTLFSMRAACSYHHILPDLITQIIFGEAYKFWRLLHSVSGNRVLCYSYLGFLPSEIEHDIKFVYDVFQKHCFLVTDKKCLEAKSHVVLTLSRWKENRYWRRSLKTAEVR